MDGFDFILKHHVHSLAHRLCITYVYAQLTHLAQITNSLYYYPTFSVEIVEQLHRQKLN